MELLRQLLRSGAADIMNLRTISEVDVARYETDFVLADPKACTGCRIVNAQDPVKIQCDGVTMFVHPLNPIAVYSLENWIKTFPAKKRNNLPNCDYIFADADDMYASRKIAFCDITCSESKFVNQGISKKYPQGKRQYVLTQILSMVSWLIQNPMLHHHISTATDRQYIFGVRYTDPLSEDQATMSMQSFSKTPSSTTPTISTVQYLNQIPFTFVEVTYPTPLVW